MHRMLQPGHHSPVLLLVHLPLLQDLDTGSVGNSSIHTSMGSGCMDSELDRPLTAEDVLMLAEDDKESISLALGPFPSSSGGLPALVQDNLLPSRFPANATGIRSPRIRARGVCAFAAAALQLTQQPEDSSTETTWAVPSGPGGVVRDRSRGLGKRSGSAMAAMDASRRCKSPSPLMVSAAEPMCNFGGFLSVDGGGGSG